MRLTVTMFALLASQIGRPWPIHCFWPVAPFLIIIPRAHLCHLMLGKLLVLLCNSIEAVIIFSAVFGISKYPSYDFYKNSLSSSPPPPSWSWQWVSSLGRRLMPNAAFHQVWIITPNIFYVVQFLSAVVSYRADFVLLNLPAMQW